MSPFICPHCKQPLHLKESSLFCQNNHTFDLAKSGYVNLLLSQKSKARQHGDDKLMLKARQSFLDKGYYRPLLRQLCALLPAYLPATPTILDAGCGECWYTAGIGACLKEQGISAQMVGVDISKDALMIGAKRDKKMALAVASVFQLPLADQSCDAVLSFFAPFSEEELCRVLAPQGVFVRVRPLERHLWSLKQAVYQTPYENDLDTTELSGFVLDQQVQVREQVLLQSTEDICNVFTMTPYYYKTSPADRAKLEQLQQLKTETEFEILVYRKA